MIPNVNKGSPKKALRVSVAIILLDFFFTLKRNDLILYGILLIFAQKLLGKNKGFGMFAGHLIAVEKMQPVT